MTTTTNAEPNFLLCRYFTHRGRFQKNYRAYLNAVSAMQFTEVVIKSLTQSLPEYPKGTNMRNRIMRELITLKETHVDQVAIVKMRKKIMIASKILTAKYSDLYHAVISMNRMGRGVTTIDSLTEDDRIHVLGHRTLETGEVKTFMFER